MIFTGPASLPTTQAPLPVTVQLADSGRWLPYSRGNRNSFSAVAKWLEVSARTCSPAPAATASAARESASPMVEQAPKRPYTGRSSRPMPKEEAMDWARRSPAKIIRISSVEIPARSAAFRAARSCRRLSAPSQFSAPSTGSSSISSKQAPMGPSPSFFPTTEPQPWIYTGSSGTILCFPSVCIFLIPSTSPPASQSVPGHRMPEFHTESPDRQW